MENKEKKEFYEKMLKTSEYRLKQVLNKGMDALHEIDKLKGVDYAISILTDEVNYFKELIKKENELNRTN